MIYGGFSAPETEVSVAGDPVVASDPRARSARRVAYFALFGEEYDAYA